MPIIATEPQWSPVMKTGNTAYTQYMQRRTNTASMEPGHEDREYGIHPVYAAPHQHGLNGARS